jgi:hypothetical protein
LFKEINTYLQTNKVDVFWKEIITIYETLKDWYNDYYIYHMVGTLVLLSVPPKKGEGNAKFIVDLYTEHKDCNKTEFRDKLKSRLKEAYLKRMDKWDLSSLNYEKNKNLIKDVLLLFNIALLVNANQKCARNNYERFPFDYYKDTPIEVEHINPRNPEDNNQKSKQAWKTITEVVLRDVGENDLAEKTETNKETMEKWVTKAEIHMLGNLTLIDKQLNIGFSNGTFMTKRNHVISAMRGETVKLDSGADKEYPTSVLFPGTRWVFLREWRLGNGLTQDTFTKEFWCKAERDSYVSKIEIALDLLLGLTVVDALQQQPPITDETAFDEPTGNREGLIAEQEEIDKDGTDE